jgi:hypothetical protein
MTKRTLTAVSAAAALAATLLPMTSEAMPAFARQTGKTCLTCHFQNFPILNAYGQEFKAGGYTDMGKQGLIKGPDLSIPEVLNSTLIGKFRAVTTNESGATTGYDIPDEFGLIMGGRAAANVGFMVEASLVGNPAFAGFKLPSTVYKTDGGTRFGIVPFAHVGIGAGFGMELLNTGAVANVRVFEHGFATSAQQFVNGEYGAWGVSGVVTDASYFVNVAKWGMGYAPGGAVAPESTYLRAAWLGNIAGFESGGGVQILSGSSGAVGLKKDTSSTALDFQAQGAVASMPLGIWASYASAPKSTASATNVFNGSQFVDKTALSVSAQLGLGHFGLRASILKGTSDDGSGTAAPDNAFTSGVTYHLAQNLGLVVEHTAFSRSGVASRASFQGGETGGGKNNLGSARTTVMLETAY